MKRLALLLAYAVLSTLEFLVVWAKGQVADELKKRPEPPPPAPGPGRSS